MNTSLFGKIAGWVQFLLVAFTQIQVSAPHGWASWLTLIASLAGAVGIHAATNTAGPTSAATVISRGK